MSLLKVPKTGVLNSEKKVKYRFRASDFRRAKVFCTDLESLRRRLEQQPRFVHLCHIARIPRQLQAARSQLLIVAQLFEEIETGDMTGLLTCRTSEFDLNRFLFFGETQCTSAFQAVIVVMNSKNNFQCVTKAQNLRDQAIEQQLLYCIRTNTWVGTTKTIPRALEMLAHFELAMKDAQTLLEVLHKPRSSTIDELLELIDPYLSALEQQLQKMVNRKY